MGTWTAGASQLDGHGKQQLTVLPSVVEIERDPVRAVARHFDPQIVRRRVDCRRVAIACSARVALWWVPWSTKEIADSIEK